jgi:hypothetical protein
MIVECGWCKRIIEVLDEDDELRTAKAIDIYSRHVIVEHRTESTETRSSGCGSRRRLPV